MTDKDTLGRVQVRAESFLDDTRNTKKKPLGPHQSSSHSQDWYSDAS